jgi:hypothetical protein
MVSKEYVQTARPYDRDLASPGAWIETGLSSRDPRWVTVTAFYARPIVTGTGVFMSSILQLKKIMRALTSELACGGVMLQDRSRCPCSKIEHRKLY